MALPPTDIPASELFRKLQQAPRPSEIVDFPRKDGEGKAIDRIRIMVLTHLQQDEARERAQQYLLGRRGYKKEDLRLGLNEDILGDAVAREALALACHTIEPLANTDPPRYGRIFPSGESVGQVLIGDEIAVLFRQYETVQRKWGPLRDDLTEDEVTEWIRVLAEGAGSFPLSHLTWLQLGELSTSLAQRSFMLSETLERHYSTLPDTLKSDLATLNFGTGFFGEQRAPDSEDGPPTDGEGHRERLIPEEMLTPETAAKLALKLRG